MSAREKRPIVPAPPSRRRYPRVGAVWGAFAAGTLGVGLSPILAHADCALPAHAGTVDPAATNGKGDGKGDGKTTKGKKPKVPTGEEPRPLPGRMAPPQPLGGEPMRVQPVPVEGKSAPVRPPDGAPPRVLSPQVEARPPMPGGAMSVTPAKPCKLPKKGGSAQKPPQLDGDVASVGPVRYIHPHGPDEPCTPPGAQTGRLVIRFT